MNTPVEYEPRIWRIRRPANRRDVWRCHGPVTLLLGLVLLAAQGFAFVAPAMPSCLFLRITGVPCLSCGYSRAFGALAAGDLAGAWCQCPFALLLYGLLAVCFAINAAALLLGVVLERGRWLKGWRLAGLGACLLLLALANWMYRLLNGLT